MTRLEHIITVIMEEAGEIVQDCSKSNRFGLDDIKPHTLDSETNLDRLIIEYNQLIAMMELFAEEVGKQTGHISVLFDSTVQRDKKQAFEHYLHYSEKRGTLTQPRTPFVQGRVPSNESVKVWIEGQPDLPRGTAREYIVRLEDDTRQVLTWLSFYNTGTDSLQEYFTGWCRKHQTFAVDPPIAQYIPYNGLVTHYEDYGTPRD